MAMTMTRPVSSKGRLTTLDETGDIVLTWDRNDPASVEKARGEFEAAVSRGFGATGRLPRARAPKAIHEFTPELAEITLIPPRAAG
jgi:hypothetical protein